MRGIRALVAVMAAGAAAYASAAAADPPTSVLHGCRNADSGLLRLVAEGTGCADGWEPVSWLVEAPAGAAGAQGLPGEQGPLGAAGPRGADGVVPESVAVTSGDEAAAAFDAATRTLRVTVPRGDAGPAGDAGERGEDGPRGPFSGRFESPNGLFAIRVSNAGIVVDAGTSELRVDAARVAADGPTVAVTGGTITLNGTCSRVARLGDFTTNRLMFGPFGVPIWLQSTIATGSTSVFAC